MSQIKYIGVPLWQGSGIRGVETAPSVLFDELSKQSSYNNATTAFHLLPELDTTEVVSQEKLYHLMSAYLSDILKKKVLLCHQNHQIPIIIGGDHSVGLGSVAASLEQDRNLGLIWFDAHGDMNTETSSPSGHIHGMPIAGLLGLCQSELNTVANINIKPENIFLVGTRSLDAGELELTKSMPFNVYSTEYVHKIGMANVAKIIHERITSLGITNIHCSIDVDAMDPSIIKATGVPVKNGLNNYDFQIFINFLSLIKQKLLAIDFVEYNPLLENSERDSLKWCVSALAELHNILI